jgi:hypothetical protein
MACVILLPVWISTTGQKEKHVSMRSGITGTPYVLTVTVTVTAGTGDLTTSKMDRTADTVVHRQMWATLFGVL